MQAVRHRERSPIVQGLIDRFTKELESLKVDAEEKGRVVFSLRMELRRIAGRLRRYEREPPIFPLPMLQQIKLLRHFGAGVEEIAALYRVPAERIERVLADQEVPLIETPIPPLPKDKRRRAIEV